MSNANGNGPGLYDLAARQAAERDAAMAAQFVLAPVEQSANDWLAFLDYMHSATAQTALTWLVDALHIRDLISFMDRVQMSVLKLASENGYVDPDDLVIIGCQHWLIEPRVLREPGQVTDASGNPVMVDRDIPSILGVIFDQMGLDLNVTER